MLPQKLVKFSLMTVLAIVWKQLTVWRQMGNVWSQLMILAVYSLSSQIILATALNPRVRCAFGNVLSCSPVSVVHELSNDAGRAG